METVTLNQVNQNILFLQREVERIRDLLEEGQLELDESVVKEIEDSRKRQKKEFISHEDMKKEFGDD